MQERFLCACGCEDVKSRIVISSAATNEFIRKRGIGGIMPCNIFKIMFPNQKIITDQFYYFSYS